MTMENDIWKICLLFTNAPTGNSIVNRVPFPFTLDSIVPRAENYPSGDGQAQPVRFLVVKERLEYARPRLIIDAPPRSQ